MYHVLIAVDEDMDEPTRLADAIASLPKASDAVEVTVLNVFKQVEVTGEGGKFDSKELYDEGSIPETARAVQQSLEEKGITVTIERRHGDPATEILSAATDVEVDVIVIGGRKRSPVGKAVFGSVGQSVILESNQPVMSVPIE